MAYFDFASKIGVAKSKLFDDYRELIRANIGALIVQEHYALISRPPVKICRDENNNLHCITDFAIKFADGYGQHYLWGVYFSPLDFQKYVIDRVCAKDLFAVQNQEQKAALIKLYGYEKLLEELPGIRVVDKLEKQGKMHVLYTWDLSREVHPTFLMVEDFSSDRRYFIGVPGSFGSALDALAWTFNVSSEEYAKLTVET
jgi:hypothetical protein